MYIIHYITSPRLHRSGWTKSDALLLLKATAVFQPKCDVFLPETSQGFVVKIDVTREFSFRVRQRYYSLRFNNFEGVEIETDLSNVPGKVVSYEKKSQVLPSVGDDALCHN